MSLYAQTATSLNPGLCTIVCSRATSRAKANGNSGQNWQRVNIPAIDPLLQPSTRPRTTRRAWRRRRRPTRSWPQDQVRLPLDPLPNIVLWSNKIVGPVGDNPMLSACSGT